MSTVKRDPRKTDEVGGEQIKATAPEKRKVRIPVGSATKLHVSKHLIKEGYRYYWGIDRPGFLDSLIDAGYEFVTNEKGENMSVHAGNGHKHFLMRVEQRYYDEDMASQMKQLDDATFAQAALAKDEYTVGGRGIGGEGVAIKRERYLI